MRGLPVAILLGIAAALLTAGCGSTGNGVEATVAEGRALPGIGAGTSIAVSPTGTAGFVPVGATGVSVLVPPGTLSREADLSVAPVSQAMLVGAPFPGSDKFITALRFASSGKALPRPVVLQIPLPGTVPLGAKITVLLLGPSGFQPFALVNSPGRSIFLPTSQPGVYVLVSGAVGGVVAGGLWVWERQHP